MRKRIVILPLLVCLFISGCKQSELAFDYEQPQFAIRPDAILLEVVVPTGTSASDRIYMIGGVNGLTEENYESATYMLEKSPTTDYVYGIYLYPKDFAEGKSLADGFSLVSSTQGAEQGIAHVIADAQVGQRYRVSVASWATSGSLVKHDGFCAYIVDEIGWGKSTYLYLYKDDQPYDGPWPGNAITGTEEIDGVSYYYFDFGEAATDQTLNLIFSNNGSDQLPTISYTVSANVFYRLTVDGVEEIKPDVPPVEGHDGDAIYILNRTDWKKVCLYTWGDVNNLHGGWPGMKPTGTEKIGLNEWMYFDMGAANKGLKQHLIPNDGNANKVEDALIYTLSEDSVIYMILNNKSVIFTTQPDTCSYFEPVEPEPAIVDLYVYDATDTFRLVVDEVKEPLRVYAWGADECFGGWPGSVVDNWEQVDILGLPLSHYTLSTMVGNTYNLIFSTPRPNNQLKDYPITITEPVQSFYLKITDGGVQPLKVQPLAPLRP